MLAPNRANAPVSNANLAPPDPAIDVLRVLCEADAGGAENLEGYYRVDYRNHRTYRPIELIEHPERRRTGRFALDPTKVVDNLATSSCRSVLPAFPPHVTW